MLASAVALAALLPVYAGGADSAPAEAGVCAECHDVPAGLAAAHGGHGGGLACADCHVDRRPGRFARRHRAIPRCRDCHDVAGHPLHANGSLRTGNRACLACHEPHGSPNASLVRTAVRTPGSRRLAPVTLLGAAGAAPGGLTDPLAPGTGLCEVCHRHTEVYRADGRGAAHFTDSCVLCHVHAAGFEPVVDDRNCGICHESEAGRFAKRSLHTAGFTCSGCHAELAPSPGEGHRAVPTCESCHAGRATHAPPGATAFACTHCHDAHGSDNAQLVLETITTPQGALRPIRFDNLLGRADGSFASASAPGTGICEVCHTQTRFYRADGAAEEHFEFSCLPCHLHGTGFAPP